MRNQRGITLVALVITIIILLILAGITISMVLGENGLIARTKQVANEYKNAAADEQVMIGQINNIMDGNWPESSNPNLTPVVKNGKKIKSWGSNANTDFHASSVKNTITTIEFVDLNEVNGPETLNNTSSWDVSKDGNESVKAWIESGKLYIGGIEGVKANEDSSYLFYSFPNLTSISFGNNFDTSDATNMSWMFANSTKLERLDLSSFNTSNVTNMHAIFAGVDVSWNQTKMSLREINTSSFNTSNVTDMSAMFTNCSELTEIDVSNFDTRSCTTLEDMFNMPNDKTSKLTKIKFGQNWNTSNVTVMGWILNDAPNIKEIDLSMFNTQSVTLTKYMFSNCTGLKRIYVGENWNMNNVTSSENMFYNCTALVGGIGTKFNSGYIDKTYARADKKNQAGYLTDIRANIQSNNTELEYIESVDTQYIDTGVLPNNNTSLEVEGYSAGPISLYGVFGIINATGWGNGDFEIDYNRSVNEAYISSVKTNTRHVFKHDKNKFYIDGVLEKEFSSDAFSSNYSIFLFARNKNGALNDNAKARIYYTKIWDGDTLVRDLVPVYNSIIDGYGMYDKVEHKFYGNSGSGQFTAGNPINNN